MDFSRCPRCRHKTKRAESFAGTDSEFWLECTACNTYINTYIPQEHQYALHADGHKYIGNFGGYGSGKTLTSREEVIKHMLITPNANVAVGANVAHQYEQTIKRELENDIPKAFVSRSSVQKNYMDLNNGARLMWRSLDDPGKLRSLNLSMFVIIEGSESTAEVFAQLKTRLRNLQASVPELDEDGDPILDDSGLPVVAHDWRRGLVESNPDSGYIRTDILLVSDEINQFGATETDHYDQDPERINRFTSTYVTATSANKYLPKTYEQEQAENKPSWWVRRYLYGSFQFSEGLVYPAFMTTVISPIAIQPHWLRVLAFDYGLSDKASFVLGAIDPDEGILYIYENRTSTNMNIGELSAVYKDMTQDIPQGGFAFPNLIDPKSGVKRDYNKKTLIDLFLEEGIYFEPGAISVDARVMRLNTYIESGRVKVFDTCTEIIEEMREYKFPPKSLDGSSRNQDKPIDKNNHSINPLEWIVMRLPADPKRLTYGTFNSAGLMYGEEDKELDDYGMPWQLSDQVGSFDEDSFNTPSFDIFEL